MEELVEAFDYTHMSKSPAVFDTVKLKWMNGEYLKAMDFDRFYEMARPYIEEVVTRDCDTKKIAASGKDEDRRSCRISASRLISLRRYRNMMLRCIRTRR